MSKSRGFSFPKLKYQEIIVCLKDMAIPVTMQDIKQPTEATLRPILERLVENIMDLTKEEMRQPHFKAIDTLQHPELHEESLGEVLMCKAILEMVRAAGLSTMSLRDIFSPTPKMTKIVLSALINFSKFRYERSATFESYTQQTDEINQIGLQVEKENQDLHSELGVLREDNKKNQPIIVELEQETTALANEISDLNIEHSELSKETRRLKTSTIEVNESIASDKVKLLQAQQEVARLKQQVVKSPKKLRQKLHTMSNTVESDKEEVTQINTRLIAMKTKNQGLIKLKDQISKQIATMKHCEAQLDLSRKQNSQIRELTNSAEHFRRLTEQLAKEEVLLKEQIVAVQRKLQVQTQQFQHKKQAAQTALDKVLDEKRLLEDGINKENEQLKHNVAVLQSRRKQLMGLRVSHKNEKAELLHKYKQLALNLKAYHDALLQKMR